MANNIVYPGYHRQSPDSASEFQTRKRLHRPTQIYTPPPNVTSRSSKRDYTLNVRKQLVKKADDCHKEPLEEHHKAGGNTVVELNTAAYEIFKKAIRPCLTSLNFRIEEEIVHDRQGATTQDTLHVFYVKKSGDTGRKVFTVNMYHTTSKVLINGREHTLYNKQVKPLIDRVIDSCPNLQHINNYIHNLCREQLRLANNASTTSVKSKAQTEASDVNSAAPMMIQSTVNATESSIPPYPLQAQQQRTGQHPTLNAITCKVDVSTDISDNTVSHEKEPEDAAIRQSPRLTVVSKPVQVVDSTNPLYSSSTHQPQSTTRLPMQDGETSRSISYDSCRQEDDGSFTCPICQQRAVRDITDCDTCQEWFHQSCIDAASQTQKFVCKLCRGEEGLIIQAHKPAKGTKSIHMEKNKTPSVSIMSTPPIPTSENFKLQELLAKEKELNQREKTLNQREKKIRQEENVLKDTSKQLATAKTYLINLEQDILDLRESNRILKLKVASSPPEHEQQTYSRTPYPAPTDNEQLSRLNQRVTDLEIQNLKARMEALEQRSGQPAQPQNMVNFPPPPLIPPVILPPWYSYPPPTQCVHNVTSQRNQRPPRINRPRPAPRFDRQFNNSGLQNLQRSGEVTGAPPPEINTPPPAVRESTGIDTMSSTESTPQPTSELSQPVTSTRINIPSPPTVELSQPEDPAAFLDLSQVPGRPK